MHVPVLKKEVIEYLSPKENGTYIDCTAGFGGHSEEILKHIGENGKLLMIEWDKDVFNQLKEKYGGDNRVKVVNDTYANLEMIVDNAGFKNIDGILLDIGISSYDIDSSGRGFTFRKDEPLDMRFNKENEKTASEVVNSYNEDDIEAVLREYGEERFSRRIAKKIIEYRKEKKIESTFELAEIIKQCLPGWKKDLSRSFQAIRIEVNQELNNLQTVLPQCVKLLSPGGRLVIISFHSLEDRIVKNYFKEQKEIAKVLTKKPVIATEQEILNNSRSKPAKLRALQKI